MRRLRFAALVVAAAAALGIAPGVAAAADFSVCGSPVKTAVDEASTPKDYQAYLGLWTGDWSNGRICSGLIIKKVTPDGDAFIVYLYRSAKASTLTPQSAIARIENHQTLSFNDKDGGRYTFVLRPGNELSATFLSTSGTRLEAQFRRAGAATAASAAQGSDEEQVRAFLKELFAKGGIAAKSDKALSALFRENDQINKKTGDKPLSVEANACECEDSSQAKYTIRTVELLGTSGAFAAYEAVYGGQKKDIRLTLSKEGGEWRVSDLSSKGTEGSLLLQITKLNKELTKLAASDPKATPQPPSSNAKPDAQDCFMGECFKQFIIRKSNEGATTVVEVRTEHYNAPEANITTAPAAPTTERYTAACGSPGYIQVQGGRRLPEPEPDPPHATKAAKQLWEAICGKVAAEAPPIKSDPPTMAKSEAVCIINNSELPTLDEIKQCMRNVMGANARCTVETFGGPRCVLGDTLEAKSLSYAVGTESNTKPIAMTAKWYMPLARLPEFVSLSVGKTSPLFEAFGFSRSAIGQCASNSLHGRQVSATRRWRLVCDMIVYTNPANTGAQLDIRIEINNAF